MEDLTGAVWKVHSGSPFLVPDSVRERDFGLRKADKKSGLCGRYLLQVVSDAYEPPFGLHFGATA